MLSGSSKSPFFASIIRTLMTEMELFFEMLAYMNTIDIPAVFLMRHNITYIIPQ